ncbi:TATA box-binding protein-associated factor RNA polymerase I subunit B [Vicia villosa]|uniref:TATA box-binding protein-associated factor RNA polymerase I subunit B n=1 Tax=Vicia villosa TaxID=3911 RepID=UPI00273B2AA8|nr:TATA box-binding protein-associated factor RNA polymerase I subunit B [Vicia villosa]
MVELQCEALVKEFKVTPLICGLVGPIWLRFIAKTGVFDEDWANKVLDDSETQKEGEPEDYNTCGKYRSEPHNMYGQRAVFIWFRSLKNRIPLVSTIVVSYLACHIAREAIMPSDIIK